MRSTSSMRAIRSIFAITALFGMGGGCIAIYGFDEFEKEPPKSCEQAAECPGSDLCGQRVCEQGLCKVVNPIGQGILVLNQLRGDCHKIFCDGNGNEIVEIDESDVPSDGKNCTDDLCINGAPSNPPSAAMTPCGVVESVTCDGAGECVNCIEATDCGTDTACVKWSCTDSTCVRELQPIGTVVEDPVTGDCKKIVCDVTGEAVETFVPEDAPSDGNPCTIDLCTITGETTHQPLPEGEVCDDCKVCSASATCDACDASTSDCHQGSCIPKPQTCTDASECASGYCVDGFCCNNECASLCMACSNAKTGEPSGFCAPITMNTDPDGECNNPQVDVCVDGKCQCENGIQDGLETGVDCGGPCAPCAGTWDCGGANVCNGDIGSGCCSPNCAQCTDRRNVCKSLQGNSCALGSPQQVLTLGTEFNLLCGFFTGCKSVVCTCK